MDRIIKRGDIYYANLNPVIGSEQGGTRPVLIISNDTGNKHSPTVINVMRMNGTLEQYLKDIDKDAQDMFDKLTKQLADSEGINEELKSAKEIEWIRSMNSIRNRAEEIVLSEMIYN